MHFHASQVLLGDTDTEKLQPPRVYYLCGKFLFGNADKDDDDDYALHELKYLVISTD